MPKTIALNVLVISLYVLFGRLTFAASIEYSSVIFAPEGIAFAFVILYGRRLLPAIFIGQTLLSYWAEPILIGGLIIGSFNTTASLVGFHLFNRWNISKHFNRLRDVGLFIFMVLFVLQPISATGAALTLLLLGQSSLEFFISPSLWQSQVIESSIMPISLVPVAWLHWWIGNSIGQLLFCPLVIAWLIPVEKIQTNKNKKATLVGIFIATISVGAIVLISLSNFQSAQLLILAITYPLLVWVGLSYGIRTSTVTNVLIALAIVWIGANGYGFMSHLSELSRFYYLSFFTASTVIFSLTLFAMFEERRGEINKLTELACIDSLTNVYNRRFFLESSEKSLSHAKRHQQELCLAILDIDHFKRVNDTYGHQAGDKVLHEFAQGCKKALRKNDTIGRYGGEEFVLLFPVTSIDSAYLIINKLCQLISKQPIVIDEHTAITITFSAGITALDINKNDSLCDLLSQADTMLYKAKEAGRNQALIFSKKTNTSSQSKTGKHELYV